MLLVGKSSNCSVFSNPRQLEKLCVGIFSFQAIFFVEENLINTNFNFILTLFVFVVIGFDSCSTSWEEDNYGQHKGVNHIQSFFISYLLYSML